MSELEDAMQAVDEWAEGQCHRCQSDAMWAEMGFWIDEHDHEVTERPPDCDHTCDKEKARAKRLALAALEFDHAFEDDRPLDERICVAGACGACAAIDELDRHWPPTAGSKEETEG